MTIFRSLVFMAIALFCGTSLIHAQEGAASASKTDSADSAKHSALIVDGQNNHGAWPKTTMMMKKYLEDTGLFTVDIYRSKYTWRGDNLLEEFGLDDGKTYEPHKQAKPDPEFKPDFSKYDVVISNFGFGAADWPEETQKSFVEFVKNGGGFVSVHAADNSFPKWREYNEMIGLGGWGNRDEKSGPYVYFDKDGNQVRDESKGKGGGHGPQHEFPLVVRDTKHPIMKGLPETFMHAQDELYERLRGPALNMNILATAYAAPDKRGSGRHEPTLMTIKFGDGRIFHSTLGHADYSCECVAFITTFVRGTEWAATGNVTIPVPSDFPTDKEAKSRKFELAAKAEK